MLYYIFDLLRDSNIPGARLMSYITFRSGLTFLLSLCIAIFAGSRIIKMLKRNQVGEVIRDLDLPDLDEKAGTPTMGGIIIILSIVVPCLLTGNLSNIYMQLLLFATIWMGFLGFMDDYLKLKYHNKAGMKGKFKIIGQVGLGLVVGVTMMLSPNIVMRQNIEQTTTQGTTEIVYQTENIKSPQTTIPFVKNNNFDYAWLTGWMGPYAQAGGWAMFIIVTVLAVAATSNGANLTDGQDGLCTGVSAIIATALAIMAYLGANVIYSSYLDIMYIPHSEELVVFMAAFIGALIGFLWYNAPPASVYMGDTGSLTIGGIIAVFAILIRKELLIPLLCAIFFVEDLSVMLQVGWFKFAKKFLHREQRILKMAPLHHHFARPAPPNQNILIRKPVEPIKEQKITIRFWIVAILLAATTFVTLKIR